MILYLIPPQPVKRRIRKAPSPFQAKEHQSRAHRPGRQISVGTARSVTLVGRPPRVFETAKNLEALIYGRQIRVAPAAASGCRHCRPMADRFAWPRRKQVHAGSACRRQVEPGTARGGNADKKFPENSGNSQTLAASIYGGQWSSPGCAAASGCRHCRPAGSGCRHCLPG